jgi:hypothetical protein
MNRHGQAFDRKDVRKSKNMNRPVDGLKIAVSVVRSRPWALFEFNSYKRPWFEIEEAPERNVHGFKGYRLKQEQLAMLQKKKPALLRAFFALPTAVSASAEAKAYARPAITIAAAIVWPTVTTVIPAVVRPRSVAVAAIIRAVVTVAIVAITTTGADVG